MPARDRVTQWIVHHITVTIVALRIGQVRDDCVRLDEPGQAGIVVSRVVIVEARLGIQHLAGESAGYLEAGLRTGRLHAAEGIPGISLQQLASGAAQRAGRIQMILVVVITHVRGRASAPSTQHRSRLKRADALIPCKYMEECLALLLLVQLANPHLQLGLVFALPQPGSVSLVTVFYYHGRGPRLRESSQAIIRIIIQRLWRLP